MRDGQAFLNDPEKGLAWVVTLPELLPITEALELIDGLRANQVTPAGVILNRLLDDPFEPEEREALDALLAERPMHGEIGFRQTGSARAAKARLEAGTELPVLSLPELKDASNDIGREVLVKTLARWMEPV